MTQDDVFEVVSRHVREVVEQGDSIRLDPSKSLKDYGATSLDMVEIVSASMRELRVKVPRSELNGIKDIGGLVEVLHRAVEAKA